MDMEVSTSFQMTAGYWGLLLFQIFQAFTCTVGKTFSKDAIPLLPFFDNTMTLL